MGASEFNDSPESNKKPLVSELTVSPPTFAPPAGPGSPITPASPGSPLAPGFPVAPYKASQSDKQEQTQELS